MKVLHILQSNRYSGAENVVCQIIAMFGNDPDVEMVYCSRDGQIREALAERGIRFVPIVELNAKEVKRVIRAEKPDLIHAHDMGASFYASLVCGKIPLVSHIHNNAFDSRGVSVKSILYRLAAKKAKHIFWVSQSAYEGYAFHKKFEKKSSVLYNILDMKALVKKMETDPNAYDYDIIFLGRLTYPKHPQRLISVMEQIVRARPQTTMAVVGTGDLEEEIRNLVAEKKLENNVIFLGFQSNPQKILHDSKLMIMTSRWEGTPMCALEAMALGVPIVSTPTDGLCALVEDGKTGYLCQEDEALAEKCLKIIESEELREDMSKASVQKSVQMNNIEVYRAKIRQAYKK
ncbi:MAG: glycosyltransferase [Clostridia bacterium]|nr:glycosyltransferase [Clostridia bacterium]